MKQKYSLFFIIEFENKLHIQTKCSKFFIGHIFFNFEGNRVFALISLHFKSAESFYNENDQNF
ncbi:hypothetical protein DCO46_00675 [Flavobacterium sp. HTF]|nr:hypothetical protein DCO46_00675 [Flavobacterium sp. HTF]